MARPVIWVSPMRRELARNGNKLTDMDRLAIADYIFLLARTLVSEDQSRPHDLVFQGIPLPDLTDVDLIEMGMQAFSALRRY